MRLHRFIHALAVAGALLVGPNANAQPALSPPPTGEYPMSGRDGPPPAPDMRPDWRHIAAGPAFVPDPRERADWIDECYGRMTWNDDDDYRRRGRQHRERLNRARVSCARYYDDYYAAYADYASQPMMMTPVPVAPQCVETIEHEYVDVPARRVIHRAPRSAPARRTTSDKRIRTH